MRAPVSAALLHSVLLASIAAGPCAFAQSQSQSSSQSMTAQGTVGVTAAGTATPLTLPSEPVSPQRQARALIHYERGRAYYAAGRYRSAVRELETAVRMDPGGYNLFFDLGLVYERLGRIEDADQSYRRYLSHTQDPAERERAERILSRLGGARHELADLERRPGRADTYFWGTAAGAGVLFVVGGVVLFSAIRASDQAEQLRLSGAPSPRVQEAQDSANAQHIVADVALVASVGLGIGAALLYFLRDAEPRFGPVALSAGSGGVGIRF